MEAPQDGYRSGSSGSSSDGSRGSSSGGSRGSSSGGSRVMSISNESERSIQFAQPIASRGTRLSGRAKQSLSSTRVNSNDLNSHNVKPPNPSAFMRSVYRKWLGWKRYYGCSNGQIIDYLNSHGINNGGEMYDVLFPRMEHNCKNFPVYYHSLDQKDDSTELLNFVDTRKHLSISKSYGFNAITS